MHRGDFNEIIFSRYCCAPSTTRCFGACLVATFISFQFFQVLDPKKWVWVATEATDVDGYAPAEIKETKGDTVTVEVKGQVRCF